MARRFHIPNFEDTTQSIGEHQELFVFPRRNEQEAVIRQQNLDQQSSSHGPNGSSFAAQSQVRDAGTADRESY